MLITFLMFPAWQVALEWEEEVSTGWEWGLGADLRLDHPTLGVMRLAKCFLLQVDLLKVASPSYRSGSRSWWYCRALTT
jgi:hypothetical protein